MKETYSRSKSVWQRMNARERKAAMAYGEKYKAFLDTARTERLATAEIIRRAEEKGFKPVYTMKSLKAGDKVYWNQKDKSVILAVIGKEPVHEGIKIVGSHIDSPRLDLKANPVHEQDGIVYFRTHYYGGIKKYQWTCIPLALIGVVFTKDGKKVDINIGLKDSDPVFYVSDLLIHMAQDQMKKTLAEGITGEQLQAVAGTHSEEGQTPKDAIMTLLKKEYGTGGHSGEGKISLVDYNSQGITFSFENGEKFRHSWYNVATMTESRLRDDTYLSAEQKAERAALKAEKAEEQSHKIVEVGDRFRHKITGEVSEVISLTGALPFYSDDCTIQRESSGFAVTENISYDKLLNSGMYEYIGKAEPEKEQSAPVKPEKAEGTPDNSAVALEAEKPEIPTIKNLSQLKKAIKPGMMFEITDHLRPECIGERRIVTGVSTVDFTSRKLDENGEPTGKDLHMEFDRAKNWTFDGDELTSRLDNGDMLMSFHFIDSLEREQIVQAEKEPEVTLVADEVDVTETEVTAPDKGENFTITDDALGEGGAKAKFRANVDAIKTLKTLEREKRPATAEEKETLSKYVGWGALAKAFDKDDPKWAAEYKELSELLTPQEYAQARSTVNDAFYTSPTVIDGIYEALGNFGFDGGAVLEPAIGIGNFFGLSLIHI